MVPNPPKRLIKFSVTGHVVQQDRLDGKISNAGRMPLILLNDDFKQSS